MPTATGTANILAAFPSIIMARDDMGVWCEMSGQGCRTFESFSSRSWESLFSWIAAQELKITRLDVAFDDIPAF